MIERRRILIGAALGSALLPVAASAADPQSATARLNEPGTENEAMARRVGVWDVTETLWAGPSAEPVTTTGIVAERRVIGSILQEFVRVAGDPSDRGVRRIDYLHFKRVTGQWGSCRR